MKNYLVLTIAAIIILSSCKEKKKENQEPPISALSIIKGQLHHLDTSMYQVTKFETANNHFDSAFLKREEIKIYAAPFLDLPDIANNTYHKNYDENRLIDAEQQTLSITSIPKQNNENAEVQKQMIIVDLDDFSDGKVKSVYIERNVASKDSLVEYRLYWEIDKYFSIGTIITKENQPDQTHFTKVAWQ